MSKRRKNSVKADEVPIVLLTNERTPHKAQQILMLYKAASLAQLGYMDGMDPESGEIHPLLVGLEPTDNGQFKVFPLAKLITKLETIPKYLVPDGKGNYIDYSVPEFVSTETEAGEAEEGCSGTDLSGDPLGRSPDTTIQ